MRRSTSPCVQNKGKTLIVLLRVARLRKPNVYMANTFRHAIHLKRFFFLQLEASFSLLFSSKFNALLDWQRSLQRCLYIETKQARPSCRFCSLLSINVRPDDDGDKRRTVYVENCDTGLSLVPIFLAKNGKRIVKWGWERCVDRDTVEDDMVKVYHDAYRGIMLSWHDTNRAVCRRFQKRLVIISGMLRQNNERRGGAMKQSYCYHPEVVNIAEQFV